MSRLRARIAQRLVEAQSTAALLTTFNEVDMQALMALRARYKEAFEKRHGVRLGFMSFFAKACIEALRRFPVVNASVEGSDIVYHEYYDIGDGGLDRPRASSCRCCATSDRMDFAAHREGGRRLRRARAQRHDHDRGADRRHVLDHQWRRVRLADVDADRERAAERHPRHAQDPGAAGRRGRRRSWSGR